MIERGIKLSRWLAFLKWQSTQSSNVAALKYTRSTSKLRVEFNSGSIYEYENVPEDLYLSILNASSVGSTFYWELREKPQLYPYKRIS